MSLCAFLKSLFYEGRVLVDNVVDHDGRLLAEAEPDLKEAESFLASFELEYRTDLAWEPPAVSHSSMMWAAMNIYRASSLLTFRDVDEAGVRLALSRVCPEAVNPSVAYSVDLTYRFLPDLVRLARAASPNDPLVGILRDWAKAWPLSSVGMLDLDCTPSAPFINDRCLRQLYVDRIIKEGDLSRLNEPQTREAVQVALGRHPQLSPKLAARLAAE